MSEAKSASAASSEETALARLVEAAPARLEMALLRLLSAASKAATTSVSDAPQVALPMVFPNPASTRSNVHVMFPASTDWRLVNAMGQTVSTGFSQAGSTETWRGLAEGWYVLKSNQGSTPLMVVR